MVSSSDCPILEKPCIFVVLNADVSNGSVNHMKCLGEEYEKYMVAYGVFYLLWR